MAAVRSEEDHYPSRHGARIAGVVGILIPPFFVFAYAKAHQDLFVVVYESTFQVLCLASLLRARRGSAEQTALFVAILFLTLADANYNLRTLIGYHDAGWLRYLGEGSYSVFSLAIAVFIACCSRVFAREHRCLLLLGVITAAISLVLQGFFVLAPSERSAIAQIPFSRINYWVYSMLVAAVAGLSVPFSLFTTNSRVHLFLQSLLLFQTADLSLRYQNSQVNFAYHAWAEACWAAGVAALCLVVIRELRRD